MSSSLIALLPAARMFVHKDLILCGTTSAIALASLASKSFFLSTNDSWLGKIPYAIARVAGWNASQYAYKAIKFYQKRRYLTAPALLLTIQKNEQAFERAFRDIQSQHSYKDIFDPRDPQQATEQFRKDFFRSAIGYGTCAGQADMLLKLVTENPRASSSDLLKSLNEESRIQDIFYRQMLQWIKARVASLAEAFEENSRIAPSEDLRMEWGLLSEIYHRKLAAIKKELYPQDRLTTQPFSITQSSTYYLEQLDSYLSTQPQDQLFGQVQVLTNTTLDDGLGDGRLLSGHTLFFQCAPGCYRFYEPFNHTDGFYDYPDKESFIEALRSQLIEDVGPGAMVRFYNR